MLTTRTLASVLALGAAAAIVAAPTATAAPSSGSAGGSSSSGCGPRSGSDHLFLAESHYDDESCGVQDAAIQLAHSSCRWLDAHGGTARNRITLAEELSDTVDYPYLFVRAATLAYCPRYAR
ncbi:Protein of unknown function [Nocardia farcinica]|uniref:Protein of uncharacterized function (DUF732) n=1 Tax=Nocardia farcinica TaxID=37329 RepID=A0A0H5P4U6_NOCFR|nr:DUF732 domain-containing protein [Nocardia farcinica]CRY77521.1 Protein of uncharacterised function (DUF732) [Nocardia farcinica]SIT31251.1 Protein of unknown function [Nocardia farcinica]